MAEGETRLTTPSKTITECFTANKQMPTDTKITRPFFGITIDDNWINSLRRLPIVMGVMPT